jgi:hypothetical protein
METQQPQEILFDALEFVAGVRKSQQKLKKSIDSIYEL